MNVYAGCSEIVMLQHKGFHIEPVGIMLMSEVSCRIRYIEGALSHGGNENFVYVYSCGSVF